MIAKRSDPWLSATMLLVSVATLGRRPWIATAEDMVVTKLRWARDAGRAKDRDDVRGIIAVGGSDLDWRYIEDWCERHGTRALLDEIRAAL